MILCRVLDVGYFAHPENDELFLRIKLQPIGNDAREKIEAARDENLDLFVASIKKLTQTDAHNRARLKVPRKCADLVFPKLDYEDDEPERTVTFRDVSGKKWNFRYLYRGSSIGHLLTTGWSNFYNSKMLVINDCLTFVRDRIKGDFYIGVGRVTPFIFDRKQIQKDGIPPAPEGVMSRTYLGKVSPTTVAEAAELAAANIPFEVNYYPGPGRSEFLVNADLVRRSLSIEWNEGVRVSLEVQPDNSSARKQMYRGRVVSSLFHANHHNPNPLYAASPWRMLLVEWENAKKMKREVSPWQLVDVPPPNLLYQIPDPFRSAWFDPQISTRTSLDNSGRGREPEPVKTPPPIK